MEELKNEAMTEDEINKCIEQVISGARSAATDSEEYKNCGFRVGSKVKLKGIEGTAKIDDIIMLVDMSTMEKKLGVFVKIGRKKPIKLSDYKEEIEEVVKF